MARRTPAWEFTNFSRDTNSVELVGKMGKFVGNKIKEGEKVTKVKPQVLSVSLTRYNRASSVDP